MKYTKSNKTKEELDKEAAEKSVATDPYQAIRLDDPLSEDKSKLKPKYKAKWERIRAKLG